MHFCPKQKKKHKLHSGVSPSKISNQVPTNLRIKVRFSGPKVVEKWSKSGPKLIQKWSKSGPKVVQKLSKIGLEVVRKWSKRGPEHVHLFICPSIRLKKDPEKFWAPHQLFTAYIEMSFLNLQHRIQLTGTIVISFKTENLLKLVFDTFFSLEQPEIKLLAALFLALNKLLYEKNF